MGTLIIFQNTGCTEEQQRVRNKKRKLIVAQLAQAMCWDQEDEADDGEPHKGSEDRKDKKPPEIKELFEMLYCNIEERHVTDFGIAPDDPCYLYCLLNL